MDQLKVILAAVKKHHFWVLGGVVLLVLLGVWWQATSGLATQFKSREGTLKKHFQDISDLSGAPDPPNTRVIDAIHDVHGELIDKVLKAWEYLYKQQQEKNRLPDDLGPEFINVWNSLKPDDPIPDEYRDIYWTFISNYLPRQRKRADIYRLKEGQEPVRGRMPGVMPGVMSERGVGGRDGREEIEYVGKVVWDNSDYQLLLDRFNWSSRPTTQMIRLAQEDLWVYDELLNVVRDLNEGARSHYNAPVKRIFALDIGRDATKAFAEAQDALGLARAQGLQGPGMPGMPGMPGGMPGGEGMSQGPPEMPGEGMPPGDMMGEGGMPGPRRGLGKGLLSGRYVDENAQPVPLENGVVKQPYLEFKMMPIRLSLMMDQRKIPDLMTKCANANMPIKIRQLRLSPGAGPKIDYAGRTATGAPGMNNMMPGSAAPFGHGNFQMEEPGGVRGGEPGAMPGMDMMPGGRGGAGARGDLGYHGPYDMPVEILGIIYIYNPPDKSKLGKGTATAQPGEGPAPAPATPVTEPAPAPTTPVTTPPATVPGTTPAAKPGTTPEPKPGTTPAAKPAATPAAVPGTTPAAKPGTPPAAVPAKG